EHHRLTPVTFADDARVTVLLADYISVDAAGKVTAVGAGFSITPLQPGGQTAPMHVAVMVDVPSSHVGQDFSLSLSLRDVDTGTPVLVPGPSGELEPLQIAQVMRAQAPTAPGMHLPSTLPGRVQVVLGFVQ